MSIYFGPNIDIRGICEATKNCNTAEEELCRERTAKVSLMTTDLTWEGKGEGQETQLSSRKQNCVSPMDKEQI